MTEKKVLIQQLEEMGIRKDDNITIHTSLRAIGEVEGRAEGLMEALCTVVSDGLLLVPSHTYENVRREPIYDVRNTKPCIGTLPTVAVELANQAYDNNNSFCRRSLHPCHSVVAFGKDALEYIYDDTKSTSPCPLFGSYGKLVKYHGKILLAGVGLVRNTFMHAIYEAAETTEHESMKVLVRDYDGNETERYTCGAWGYSGNFENYKDILTENGTLKFGKLGEADLIVCDAAKCFETVYNDIISSEKR